MPATANGTQILPTKREHTVYTFGDAHDKCADDAEREEHKCYTHSEGRDPGSVGQEAHDDPGQQDARSPGDEVVADTQRPRRDDHEWDAAGGIARRERVGSAVERKLDLHELRWL